MHDDRYLLISSGFQVCPAQVCPIFSAPPLTCHAMNSISSVLIEEDIQVGMALSVASFLLPVRSFIQEL